MLDLLARLALLLGDIHECEGTQPENEAPCAEASPLDCPRCLPSIEAQVSPQIAREYVGRESCDNRVELRENRRKPRLAGRFKSHRKGDALGSYVI